MKTISRPPLQHIYYRISPPNSPFLIPIYRKLHSNSPKDASATSSSPLSGRQSLKSSIESSHTNQFLVSNIASKSKKSCADNEFPISRSSLVTLGAVSLGVALLLMGFDDQKALAFGPEGPLVEEFWENMRRYALYALTVSTGVIYTGLQPILELLKNPISAILILTIIGGSIFIVSQVLTAMVGVSDFSYDYSY